MSISADKINGKIHVAQKPQQDTFFRKQEHDTTGTTAKSKPFFAPVIQPKLKVSQPDDPHEKDADEVADQVMKMPTEKSVTDGSIGGKKSISKSSIVQQVQRGATDDGEDYAQEIGSKSGSALPKEIQREMGSKMNYDFSDVKIHTDKEASQSASNYNAKAYATGNDIVFNEGKYNPSSDSGKRLLAHELTHVAQQNNGTISRDISTELPKGTAPDATTGKASFKVNKIDFEVEADEKLGKDVDSIDWRGSTIDVDATGAATVFSMDSNVSYDTLDDKITKVTVVYKVYVKTFYGKDSNSASDSEYGRGTTADDKKKKNTSLKFHESQHGKDFQDYVKNNPLPVFTLKTPATTDEYDKAKEAFDLKVKAYQDAMNKYSVDTTDETGDKKSVVEQKKADAKAKAEADAKAAEEAKNKER